MNAKSKAIRQRFLSTLESLRKEGYLYTTFRTPDNGIVNMPLKGFRTQSEATEFIKSQFAADEIPTVVESIDTVIKDIQEGRIRNWKDYIEIQQYFRERQAIRKHGESEDLLHKNRNRTDGKNRSLQ